MATNYNNDKVTAYSGDVNTAPDKYTAGTGTVTSVGRIVTGTGTLFLTEIGGNSLYGGLGNPSTAVQGAWLFNNSNEVRQIKEVISDTQLILEQAFTVDLSGASVKIVQPSRTKQFSFVLISGTVVVDGVTLATSEMSGFGDTAANNRYTLDPIVIDTTSGVLHLSKVTAN